MNKTELVAEIAARTDLKKKDVEAAVKAALDVIQEQLVKGEKVVLTGFGTFLVRHRQARKGWNPKEQKPINIAAQKSPAFKPGKGLKDSVR
jgi:DNA-binding protein HU-beta